MTTETEPTNGTEGETGNAPPITMADDVPTNQERIDRAAMGWDRLPDETHQVELDLDEHEMAKLAARLEDKLHALDLAQERYDRARAEYKSAKDQLEDELGILRTEVATGKGERMMECEVWLDAAGHTRHVIHPQTGLDVQGLQSKASDQDRQRLLTFPDGGEQAEGNQDPATDQEEGEAPQLDPSGWPDGRPEPGEVVSWDGKDGLITGEVQERIPENQPGSFSAPPGLKFRGPKKYATAILRTADGTYHRMKLDNLMSASPSERQKFILETNRPGAETNASETETEDGDFETPEGDDGGGVDE